MKDGDIKCLLADWADTSDNTVNVEDFIRSILPEEAPATYCLKTPKVGTRAIPKLEIAGAEFDAKKPDFTVVEDFMSDKIREEVLKTVNLGSDKHITKVSAPREKAIRFVMVINGKVHCLTQDFFVQNEAYNQDTGGYKRVYHLIADDVIELLEPSVLEFARYYDIPEKTVILIQIQTSRIMPSTDDKQLHQLRPSLQSITGQGIHTDGADRAVLVCLHRGDGVVGAHNQFHGSIDGSKPLCEPFALMPGNAVLWKDNEIFHYVTRGAGTEGSDNNRTIMIMHSPGEMFLLGATNENNDTDLREEMHQGEH